MTSDAKNRVLIFCEKCDRLYGSLLQIQEAITTHKASFDRHHTTSSRTEFVLTNFSARISGARMVFAGENLYYEIGIDEIIHFEEQSEELEFIEQYSETVYRKTRIQITPR